MDRREAIKKLGIGATVIGTGTLVTLPANADVTPEIPPTPVPEPSRGFQERPQHHQIHVLDVNEETDDFLHFFMLHGSVRHDKKEYDATFTIEKHKANKDTLIDKPLVEIFNDMDCIKIPSRPEQKRRKLFEMEKLRNRIAKDSLRGRANVLFYGNNGMLLSDGLPEMQTIEYLPGLKGLVLAYMGNLIYDQPIVGFINVKGIPSARLFLKHPEFSKWTRRFEFV